MKFASLPRAVLALWFALASHASAQSIWPWQLDTKLVAPDADADDRFGHAVAAQGTFALIGAPLDDEAGPDAGAVYSFRNVGGTWIFDAKIVSSLPRPNGHFGYSVALDSGFAVVGSPTVVGTTPGDAYAMRHDGTQWIVEQRFVSTSGYPSFGYSVDVWRGTLVVGAPASPLMTTGRVHVHRRTPGGWVASWTSAQSYGGGFGRSVGVFDRTLIVGGGRAVSGGGQPAVFMLREAPDLSWTVTDQLLAPPPQSGFGVHVALADGVAAVTTFQGPTAKSYVDVYEYDDATSAGLTQVAHLDDPAGFFSGTEFGFSLQFREDPGEPSDLLVVGAPRKKFTTQNDGMAHVFARFGPEWQRVARITAPDAATFDEFGRGVAVTGDQVLVGAWQADAPTTDSGAAYAYDLSAVPTSYCTAKANSLGCAPAITWNGVASASSGSGFDIGCVDVLPQKLGVLFYSDVAKVVPFRGGWLCVAAPLKRAVTQNASSGAFCDGAYSTDFNAYIATGHDPALIAGEGRFCQWATRDPADAWGSGLSQALWFEIGP